jgi:biopolymer transport protein ExbD
MRRLRRRPSQEAELDITSFMNLMIVLVPVLLLSLVFSQVRILNLQLPISAESNSDNDNKPKVLELIIDSQGMLLNYPSGILLKNFNSETKSAVTTTGSTGNDNAITYDFAALSLYLQDLKLTFQQQSIEKKDIVILLGEDINYQTIVSAMDTVRSFKAVVAASVVDGELFPEISLGDAPALQSISTKAVQ